MNKNYQKLNRLFSSNLFLSIAAAMLLVVIIGVSLFASPIISALKTQVAAHATHTVSSSVTPTATATATATATSATPTATEEAPYTLPTVNRSQAELQKSGCFSLGATYSANGGPDDAAAGRYQSVLTDGKCATEVVYLSSGGADAYPGGDNANVCGIAPQAPSSSTDTNIYRDLFSSEWSYTSTDGVGTLLVFGFKDAGYNTASDIENGLKHWQLAFKNLKLQNAVHVSHAGCYRVSDMGIDQLIYAA